MRGETHQYLAFKEKCNPGIRVMLITFPQSGGCRISDSFNLLNVLSTLLSIWYTILRSKLSQVPNRVQWIHVLIQVNM